MSDAVPFDPTSDDAFDIPEGARVITEPPMDLPEQDLVTEPPAPKRKPRKRDGSDMDAETIHLRMPKVAAHTGHYYGMRFVSMHSDTVRYVPDWQKWMVWTGTHWDLDNAAAYRLVAEMCQGVVDQEKALRKSDETTPDGEPSPNSRYDRALRKMEPNFFATVLAAAGKDEAMIVKVEALNGERHLLPVANGTVDLRTGTLGPSKPEHLFTYSLPTAYVPGKRSKLWSDFLSTALDGDRKVIRYLRVAAGMTLSGDIGNQVFFLLHGGAGTGKSTFLGALSRLLGPVADTVASGIVVRKGGEVKPWDWAALYGLRLGVLPDTGAQSRLHDENLRILVDGGALSGEEKGVPRFTWYPQHTLWLATNHFLTASAEDEALWRRCRVVSFDHRIEQRDESVRRELETNPEHQEAILAWAIAGAMLWYKGKTVDLFEPEAVTAAGKGYRNENDIVGVYLDECHTHAEHTKARAGFVWDNFVEWRKRYTARNNTILGAVDQGEFVRIMEARGYPQGRDSKGKFYRGTEVTFALAMPV